MTTRKRFVLILAFIIYAGLVWWFSLAFLPASSNLAVASVLTVCGLALLGLYVVAARQSSRPGVAGTPIAEAIQEAGTFAALPADASRRLRQLPPRGGGRPPGAPGLPWYLLLGDAGTGKTSLVRAAQHEAELLAGQVDRDGPVIPTPAANIWLSRGSLIVEAAGESFSKPQGFSQVLAGLRPLTDSTKPRGVVLCCDSGLFTGFPNLAGQDDLSRRAREHLQAIGSAFGTRIPVSVIFTKADAIPCFAEYFAGLTPAEERQVFGCTLPVESRPLSSAFNRLYASLAARRLVFLERATERAAKPAIYEFPREFKRIRGPLLQFLAEILPAEQGRDGPVLRGFYFTGTRQVAWTDGAPPPSSFAGTEVTQLLNPQELENACAGGVRPGAVTRWAFVADLFQQIVDSGPRVSAPDGRGRVWIHRLAYAAVAGLSIAAIGLLFTSWHHNRSLLQSAAAAALRCEPLAPGVAPSQSDLQRLDALRSAIGDLPRMQKPFGLDAGDAVLDPLRRLYFIRFRQYFLDGILRGLEAGLSALPGSPTPSHPYEDVYAELRAYRTITTSAVEESCSPDRDFVDWLLTKWRALRATDPRSERIARMNFEYYASELKRKNLRNLLLFQSKEQTIVQRARDYLDAFPPVEAHLILRQSCVTP